MIDGSGDMNSAKDPKRPRIPRRDLAFSLGAKRGPVSRGTHTHILRTSLIVHVEAVTQYCRSLEDGFTSIEEYFQDLRGVESPPLLHSMTRSRGGQAGAHGRFESWNLLGTTLHGPEKHLSMLVAGQVQATIDRCWRMSAFI